MRNHNWKVFLLFILLVVFFSIDSGICFGQSWTIMPPYNVLWPLWSPVLSPIDTFSQNFPLLTDIFSNNFFDFFDLNPWPPSLPTVENYPPVLQFPLSSTQSLWNIAVPATQFVTFPTPVPVISIT